LHDALGSVLQLALRSGSLPSSGGIPATVLITVTAEQFESGTGHAITSFGQRLRVREASSGGSRPGSIPSNNRATERP